MTEMISVIMPVYNSEKYVEKTIQSILNQTYTNFELIIVNDHPTDNTMELVRAFKDERIRIIDNDRNRGIAYSRNVGLKNARGEFIALMDHDDLAPDYRFERQIDYLRKHEEIGVLGGSIQLIGANDEPLAPPTNAYTNAKQIEALFLFYNVFCNCEVMFRRKIIQDNDIFYHDDCLGMEDFRFWIECSKVTKMTCLEDLLLFHRMTEKNETTRVMTELNAERKKLFSELQNLSLKLSGFMLTEEQLEILNKVLTEDQQGVCESIEETKRLYYAFREIAKQAEKMRLHNCREIKDVCRFYFTSRTEMMNNDRLWGEKMNADMQLSDERRIVVFGTGLYYQNRKKELEQENIVAFLDNNEEKVGTFLDSIPVYLPNEIKRLKYDTIILMGRESYREEMRAQLIELGVFEQKIVDYDDYVSFRNVSCNLFNTFASGNKKGKKVLMISHELTNTGAPIVLLHFAKILKNNGYSPVIACAMDGELRNDITALNIPVVIDRNINKRNQFMWEWVQTFDMVILNTLQLKNMIKDFNDCNQKVLWWLHEADNEYELCGKSGLPKRIADNISVYGVGERAISAFNKYIGNKEIKNLIYGLPDFRGERYGWHERRIVFAIIGTIMDRKGHDVFADALEYLSDDVRDKVEFWVIGRTVEQDLYEHVRKTSEKYSELKIMGALPIEEMQKAYEKIDVVVSPSRMDPMPVVLTEGMMNHKVCIASDNTGTAELITDKVDGLVCKVDPEDLAKQVTWLVNHRSKIKKIGNEARKLYEEKFGMKTFEENILNILNE